MQIKIGSCPRATPDFFDLPALILQPGGERGVGGRRQVGRGALLPANPCSFVARHHAFGVGWGAGKLGVVLRSPLTLVPSSRGTTSLGSDGLTARRFLKSDVRVPVFCFHASHISDSPKHFIPIYPTAARKSDAGTSFRSVPASLFHHFPASGPN